MYGSINLRQKGDPFGFSQRKNVLLGCKCDAFLPISLCMVNNTGDEKKETINLYMRVKTDGYIKIKSIEKLNVKEGTELFRMIIEKIESAKNYFFMPDEYIIDEDTIFVSEGFGDVRFAFIPHKPYDKISCASEDKGEENTEEAMSGGSEKKKILYVVSIIMKHSSCEAKKYFFDLYKHIDKRNMNLGSVLTLIDGIIREAEYEEM